MKTRLSRPPCLTSLVCSLPCLALVIAASALFTTASARAAPRAAPSVVSIAADSPTVSADVLSFPVNVSVNQITNETGLGGYDLYLNYNPSVIQAVSAVDSGFVQNSQNIVVCVSAYIDNTAGQIILSCVTVPLFLVNGPTSSTPQLLATATFRPVAPGISPLTLEGTTLTDPFGASLEMTIENGQVTVIQPPPPSPVPPSPEPPTETPLPETTPTLAPPTDTPPPAAAPTTSPQVPTPARTVAPTARTMVPEMGDGPGGDSSWTLPLILGGLAAAVAGSGAVLGTLAWRRRRGRSISGR